MRKKIQNLRTTLDIRQYLRKYFRILAADGQHKAELQERCEQIKADSFYNSEIELLDELIDEIELLEVTANFAIFKFNANRRNRWSTERDDFQSRNIVRLEVIEDGVENLLEEIKREAFVYAMNRYEGNMARVATYLGVSKETIRSWKKDFLKNDGCDLSTTRLMQ